MELLTLQAAAEVLGVSIRRVSQLGAAGTLPSIPLRAPRPLRVYRLDDVLRLKRARERRAGRKRAA